jgi:hypothetical protein
MTGEAISLTDNEIAMLKNKHGIVLFHMNGCGHCVNMMPAWNRVISELKDTMKNEIVLGAIERGGIEKFHQHGIKPNVNGFPTILYFNPSKLHSPEVYNNDRNYEGFKQWIMEKAKQDKTSRSRSRGRSRSRSRSKGKDSGINNNQIYMAIKDYEKHTNKKNSLMGDNNGLILKQEGGGYRKSRKNRVKRLRRTRKHRRTHRRRSHRKNYSKLHVKTGGGGCGCSKLW